MFDDFDPEIYAQLLAGFTFSELNDIWRSDTGQLWTSLEKDGMPNHTPIADWPNVDAQ